MRFSGMRSTQFTRLQAHRSLCSIACSQVIPFRVALCHTLTEPPVRGGDWLLRLEHSMSRTRALTGLILPMACLMIGAYFTYTAVQGPFGLFQRVQIEAEAERLRIELAALEVDTDRMEILTRRLSDDYLDLDLLDEQLRDILGYARPDEILLP